MRSRLLHRLALSRASAVAAAAAVAIVGGVTFFATRATGPTSDRMVAQTPVSPLPHACPKGCDIWDLGEYDAEAKLGWKVPGRVIGLSGVTDVQVANGSVLALRTDGTVWAWGFNMFGLRGNGTTKDSYAPTAIYGLKNIIQISLDDTSARALDKDGNVWVWGTPGDWEWGGPTTDTSPMIAHEIPGLTNVARVFSWTATTRDGKGYVWDQGAVKPLTGFMPIMWEDPAGGSLSITNDGVALNTANELGPTARGAQLDTGALTTGSFHSNFSPASAAGVRTDGSVVVWGAKLGSEKQENHPSPQTLKGLPATCSSVAVRGKNGYALCDGKVFAWGEGLYGGLGNGTKQTSTTAVPVSSLTDVTAIAAGGLNGYAISKGNLWAWGVTGYPGLPERATDYLTPIKVPEVPSGVQSISTDGTHLLALVTTKP